MNEQEWKDKLVSEGFGEVDSWQDAANFEYSEHTHEKYTVHVILEGSMTLADAKGTKLLHTGDRFDILAGTTHSAKMGPEGCKYLIAEK